MEPDPATPGPAATPWRRHAGWVAAVAAVLAAGAAAPATTVGAARDGPSGAVTFNEHEIRAIRQPLVDLNRPLDVLEFLIREAGGEMTVFPSEGYYYFQFQNGPWKVHGNLRFDLVDAAKGGLNFAYYVPAARGGQAPDFYGLLSARDGVQLTTLSPFELELRFRGRLTRVHLYDASAEAGALRPAGRDETYVGPVFDESGARFHLLFDESADAFLFVLDESAPRPETYTSLESWPALELGNRSAYAFYSDKAQDRRILVGVSNGAIRANSYFDGPFDQLPDRFVDPVRLQALIVRATPELGGQVGPRGLYLDAENLRALVTPYLKYDDPIELLQLAACMGAQADSHAVTRCLKQLSAR